MMGLGMPRNELSFVKQSPQHWDMTAWDLVPLPFLNRQCHAYVNALAAWFRGDDNVDWIDAMHPEIVRSTKKALKFLKKTGDSFFAPSTLQTTIASRTPSEWLQLADDKNVTSQIVAMQYLAGSKSFPEGNSDVLVQKLRSRNDAIVMHAVGAAETMDNPEQEIIEELRLLTESPHEGTQSKSTLAVARMQQLDDFCLENATKMVGSNTDFVAYAGLLALSTRESVGDMERNAVDRAFIKYLQTCNYNFVNLCAAAYAQWLPDSQAYVTELLSENQPEYLDIALEAVESVETIGQD